jgi:Bacterial Ig domain/LysM domain
MKMNPLVVFTGFALATLAALVVVEKDKWTSDTVVVAKKIEPQAAVVETPKVEAPAKADATTPKAVVAPSFDTVRVEASGETVIAGRAEPGSEVTIKYNGATVGTAMTNTDGAFVVTPEKPLPKGPGALSIEMKNKETVVASADTVAVDVKGGTETTPMVAVMKPGQPTTLIQMPSKVKPVLPPMSTVNLDTVDYDEAGNIVFSGRGPTGSKVQLYVDNKPYALADIGADGTWTMPNGEPLTVGAHELRADEIGEDGKVTSRVAIPFYREDPKKIASSTPVEVPKAPEVAAAPDVQVTMVDKTVEPPVATSTTVTTSSTATTTIEVAKTPAAPPAVALAPEAPKAVVAPESPKVEVPAVKPDVAVAAATPAEPPVAPQQIIIQPGNNLWKLSRKLYGKGTMYTVIYEANKDQIRKPGLIYPGQVFMTPDASKAQ